MTAPPAVQLRRPLLPVQAAMVVTGRSEDGIVAAVEAGQIWAWNLASPGASRRCLRLWSEDVRDFADGVKRTRRDDSAEWAEIARALFPVTWQTLTARRFAQLCTLSGTAVLALVRAKLLRLAKDSPWHRGCNGSPRILRASAVEFFQSRRVR